MSAMASQQPKFDACDRSSVEALQAGTMLAGRGMFPRAAVKFHTCYKSASANFPMRFVVLESLCSLLRLNQVMPTAKDIKLLQQIEKNEFGLLSERFIVAYTRGSLFWDAENKEKCAEKLHLALSFFGKMTDEELSVPTWYTNQLTGMPELHPVRKLLQKHVDLCLANLKAVTTGTLPVELEALSQASTDGSVNILQSRDSTMSYNFDPSLTPSQQERIKALINRVVSDGKCTNCREAGGLMQKCGRCKRVAYCTKECQVTHWKSEHKKICRAPGIFKNGDIVRVSQTVSDVLIFSWRDNYTTPGKADQEILESQRGCHFQIVGGPDDTGRFFASSIGCLDRDMAFHGADLTLAVANAELL